VNKWQVGQRIRHGASSRPYTIIAIIEDEWLDEAVYQLTIRDETGLEKTVLAVYCYPLSEPSEDAPTEEASP
jgi:hypothetical protein